MLRRLRHRGLSCRRTGFTLLESMIAASLLLVIVVAVMSAITSGQQHAYEAHVRVAGVLAAEDLMSRVAADNYNDIPDWNSHQEDAGAMVDADGVAMPDMFIMIGRRVTVTTSITTLPNGVKVRGRNVQVEAFDLTNRVVATVRRFIPEPAS